MSTTCKQYQLKSKQNPNQIKINPISNQIFGQILVFVFSIYSCCGGCSIYVAN